MTESDSAGFSIDVFAQVFDFLPAAFNARIVGGSYLIEVLVIPIPFLPDKTPHSMSIWTHHILKCSHKKHKNTDNSQRKQLKTNDQKPGSQDTKKQQAHIDNFSSWTCKNNQYSHGIKYHLLVDAVSKGVRDFKVTTASLHDSQVMLAKEGDYDLFLDKGYVGAKNLPARVTVYIPNKVYDGREPMPEEKLLNKLMSGIRCRVEHVNGFLKNFLHGDTDRYKRNPRMEVACMFKCLIYNVFRYEYLKQKAV